MDAEKGLMSTLEFISSHSGQREQKPFYNAINEFLTDKIGAESFLIFSIPDEKKVLDFTKCRVLWNRYLVNSVYQKSFMDNLLISICDEKDIENYKDFRDKEQSYLIFRLGRIRDQSVYGLCKIPEKLSIQFVPYFLKFSSLTMESISAWEELKKTGNLAHIDDITGLYNQRRLHIDLTESIKNYENFQTKFAVLFIDIDHFKNVNDGSGHIVGTELLSDMAKLMKDVLRDYDLCYRYGGDEFVVIMPEADTESGCLVGERILTAVKAHKFIVTPTLGEHEKKEIKLSVSIGVASYPDDAKEQKEILALADKMMYEAKNAGRGQVRRANEIFDK